jgi:hypothetical protein
METLQVFFETEEDDELKEDALMYHSAYSERLIIYIIYLNKKTTDVRLL